MSKRYMRREVGQYLYGNQGWRTGGFKRQKSSKYNRGTRQGKYDGTLSKASKVHPHATSLSFGFNFMPRTLVNWMQFWGGAELLSTAGGVQDVVMRANSLYDPYFDAGGEKAAGYDALITLYKEWKVIGCEAILRVVNLDSDDPVHVSLYPSTESGDDTSTAAFARPRAKTGIATAEQGYVVLKNYASSKEIIGLTYSDSNSVGAVTTNPSIAWYWHLVFKNRSTNALNLEYSISLRFRTVWNGLYGAGFDQA